MTAEYDVAIVGCGPVGALAANLLGVRGIRTVVLEREAEPYPMPRAVHLDHEMMRLFDAAGVLPEIEPLMFAADGHIHIGADGGVIRYLGSTGRPQPFSFANDYFFYQPEVERVLRGAIGRFDHVHLRLGTEVESVVQTDEAVLLTIHDGERRETIGARYVIGCDGARSVVRKAAGIALDDLDFEEPWLVVDAEVDGPIIFPEFTGVPESANLQRLSVMLCDPRRPATIVPGRGNHRRWEFMLLPGEGDAEMMESDRVAALIEPWVRGTPHRIVRAATYRFHGLVAESWQEGRIFLAGDAAHQTPPFFGQGMCHGFRDVANLAWKLDLMLSGTAGPALLATYQIERDPHVRAVIGAAVEAGRYICQLDPDLAAERDARMRKALRDSAPRTAADLIPPVRAGVVVGEGPRFIQPPVAKPGEPRARMDQVTGGGWLLLSRDADPLESLGSAERTIWAAIGGRAFVVGDDLIDLEGYLGRWFDEQGAVMVIVRPDFYVYAVIVDAGALTGLIDGLGRRLVLARENV